MSDTNVERGAAEEGSPLTPTEVEASRTAPSQSSSDAGESSGQGSQLPGEHDQADSASGTDV